MQVDRKRLSRRSSMSGPLIIPCSPLQAGEWQRARDIYRAWKIKKVYGNVRGRMYIFTCILLVLYSIIISLIGPRSRHRRRRRRRHQRCTSTSPNRAVSLSLARRQRTKRHRMEAGSRRFDNIPVKLHFEHVESLYIHSRVCYKLMSVVTRVNTSPVIIHNTLISCT